MKKIGIIFGGPSNEHEVSISSAINVGKNIDSDIFDPILVYWDKKGHFSIVDSLDLIEDGNRIHVEDLKNLFEIAFLVTHGKYGEDGVLQAILENQQIRYTGCHVLSSALCMDKIMFKDLMTGLSIIAQAKYFGFDFDLNSLGEIEDIQKQAIKELKFPLFVKPANSGSSVGITKVNNPDGLKDAILEAHKHDSRIIIEEGFVNQKEVEVAILGNQELVVSDPGQLIVPGGFYDYDEKYKLDKTKIVIPADLTEEETRECKALASKVYKICGCGGFARVDLFVLGGKVFINEINTLPGFTNISMYPKLMATAGIGYKELITKIIELIY